MREFTVFYAIIALFILLLFSTEGMCFAGAADIKVRMQERLPTIVQMKTEGIVGENNKGYLEFVPGAAKKMQDPLSRGPFYAIFLVEGYSPAHVSLGRGPCCSGVCEEFCEVVFYELLIDLRWKPEELVGLGRR